MRRILLGLATLLALSAIAWGIARLQGASSGLSVTTLPVGEIPARVFRPAGGAPAPVVVIAHGFAGSQEMMQPFATTLAQAGFIAVTFDFPGHGGNPTPLAGGLTDDEAASGTLLSALTRVVAAVRPLGDGRLALLGHSMAADIVIRWGFDRREAAATVALSGFGPQVTAEQPRNLMVAVGAWEPEFLQAAARRIVALAAGGEPAEDTTYGRFADGTARRLVIADGVEHIGILYSQDALAQSRAWLAEAFGRAPGRVPVDARGPAIGLLVGGLVLLAWPLSRLLPRVAAGPPGAGLGWRRFWPIAVVPAVATPLILRLVPTGFMPLLLGDYLTAHCALYGVLTGLLAWRLRPRAAPVASSPAKAAIAAAAILLYLALLGGALDHWVIAFLPAPHRLVLVPIVLLGTLPWFATDEWATRAPGTARGAYAATKALFLLSLMGAVALDPPRLFFLIIIVPVMLVFLLAFGLFSRWSLYATGSPWPAAAANAVALACAIAATFPMVPR